MISPLQYSLNTTPRIKWSATQENALATDFPFALDHESDNDFVVRTYLQFLWLPESIVPLKLLVPSLLRVHADPEQPHPLHAYLQPLLQTARSASKKYSFEVPQILSNGGGAGEIEEATMWYALSYAKADDDLWTRTSTIGDGPWEDETWRGKWLEKMERREYQIQILLYFLKLSLPGSVPSPSPQKGKRKRSKEDTEQEIPPVERLEFFLDKLSMWQLVADLGPGPSATSGGTMDWMQAFFEEIVKPQFEHSLPDHCALMRSKLFPNSPFSSSSTPSSPSSSRAASPDLTRREASPAPSTSSIGTSTRRPPTRERSRSLSVSLAQERMERERNVTTLPKKKRMLNREVSMSRVFKPKPKPKVKPAVVELQKDKVKGTKDEGVLLVEETPTKPVRPRTQSFTGFSLRASFGGDGGEDEWRLPASSSPDILLLEVEKREEESLQATPTKRPRQC